MPKAWKTLVQRFPSADREKLESWDNYNKTKLWEKHRVTDHTFLCMQERLIISLYP